MPANLTPQYRDADERFRRATEPEDKLRALKEMMALIPKHKGTEKMQADIKRRIKQTKEEMKQRGGAGRRSLHHVDREGAAQILLVGPPNAGKSSLLDRLTNASPEIGVYPYTTHQPQPGMMPYENIQFQLVDMPPISTEYFEPWVTNMVRIGDGVLLVADLSVDDTLDQLEVVLDRLQEARLHLTSRPFISDDPRTVVKKALMICNKCDAPGAGERLEILRELYADRFELLPSSCQSGSGLEELKVRLYALLDILRVFSKPPGGKAEMTRPFVFPRGSTLQDLAEHIHKDFADKLKFARIWGTTKYDGQKVHRDYQLQEGDILELHI